MKYTIEGFSQAEAVRLGLNAEDLVILRWFVDFFNSDKMVKMNFNGQTYSWVSYKGFMEQMPIINCNKRTIAAKFHRLVAANVLTNETIKQGGTFSVYGFGSEYSALVDKTDTVVEKTATGLSEKQQPGCQKNSNQNTNLLEKNNLLENSNMCEQGKCGKHEYDKLFEEWYSHYPKKEDKCKAFELWKKLNPDREFANTLIAAVEKLKTTDKWKKENGQYIPQPSKWLRNRRWEDEDAQPEKKYITTYRLPEGDKGTVMDNIFRDSIIMDVKEV